MRPKNFDSELKSRQKSVLAETPEPKNKNYNGWYFKAVAYDRKIK